MTSSLMTTHWGRVPSVHRTCYPVLARPINSRAYAVPSVPVPPDHVTDGHGSPMQTTGCTWPYVVPIGEDPAAHGHWCTFTDLCHAMPCHARRGIDLLCQFSSESRQFSSDTLDVNAQVFWPQVPKTASTRRESPGTHDLLVFVHVGVGRGYDELGGFAITFSVRNHNVFVGLQNKFTRGFLVPNCFCFHLHFFGGKIWVPKNL